MQHILIIHYHGIVQVGYHWCTTCKFYLLDSAVKQFLKTLMGLTHAEGAKQQAQLAGMQMVNASHGCHGAQCHGFGLLPRCSLGKTSFKSVFALP